MDVRFFLGQRLTFVAQLYTNSTKSFLENKRLIEAEEEPYVPVYSEDGGPPFIAEWIEAEESLQVLGHACLSMLSASFHLYFKGLEHQLHVPAGKKYGAEFKRGWFNGYRAYFRDEFAIKFEDSNCNLCLLEEVVLVRNRVQHPEWITSQRAHYSTDDLEKLKSPFFIEVRDAELFNAQEEGERSWLMRPAIHVNEEKFLSAVSEVARFAEWLENAALSSPEIDS